MDVSQKRIEANRRNALKSTGPRTAEGKERCRGNALKHGLCAELLTHPEEVASEAATPHDFRAWANGQIEVLAGRLDRLDRMEREERRRVVARAGTHWEEDRRGEAEALGARIRRDPAAVVDKLRRTPQGCEWLAARWAMLARVADRDGRWDPAQVATAFDLMGTPVAFRGGEVCEKIRGDGTVAEASGDPLAFARGQADALLARRDGLAQSDAFDRSLAEADVADDTSPLLRRLRRYESALFRRLRWCLDQLAGKPSSRTARHEDRTPPSIRPTGRGFGATDAGGVIPSGVRCAETSAPLVVAEVEPSAEPVEPVALSVGIEPEPEIRPTSRRPRDPAALRAELRRDAKRDRRERLRA